MYLQHWHLHEAPFRHAVDARWFYQGPVQEEALARLQFLVEHRHPLGILIGPGGAGKSLVLEVFAGRLRQAGKHHVSIQSQGCDLVELYWKLAVGLGLNPGMHDTHAILWRKISDRFAQHRSLGRDLVLLIDDIDLADEACQSGVLRLLATNRTPEARLSIVLAGRTEGIIGLSPRLLEQTELRIEVEALSEADCGPYLAHCLAQAGRSETPFSNAAVHRIQELSGGNPRLVNHLAELALVAAASQDMAAVDTEVVDGAYHELGLVEYQRQAG